MISKVKITDTTIETSTDEQLDELIYTKGADLYLGTFGEFFKDTDNDKLLKSIFAITVLDNEVKNGGFDSFFQNCSELANSALEGLTLISADQHANLCRQAIEMYHNQRAEFKNQRNTNLGALDEQYYSLPEVRSQRQRFIRNNINKFMD